MKVVITKNVKSNKLSNYYDNGLTKDRSEVAPVSTIIEGTGGPIASGEKGFGGRQRTYDSHCCCGCL